MAGEVVFGFPCRQQCEALEQAQFTAIVLSAAESPVYHLTAAATSVTWQTQGCN